MDTDLLTDNPLAEDQPILKLLRWNLRPVRATMTLTKERFVPMLSASCDCRPVPSAVRISCATATPAREPAGTSRASIAILGVPFDNVTILETVALVEQMVASGRPHYVVTANVDFLVQGARDIELRRILSEAHLVLCDGTPLVWASRWLGNALPERVAGSDLVPLLIRTAAQRGHRLFFLGGSPEATVLAVTRLQEQYPSLKIAGSYSPPYSRLLEMDQEDIRHRIQAVRPDLLFVSFGCPKQEKWIAMNYRTLGVPVAMGVGGTIDFLAGRIPRAPQWMQRTGTEWMFRLAREPRRLFKRYATDCCLFFSLFAQQWCRLAVHKARTATEETCEAQWLTPSLQEVVPQEWLDAHAVQREAPFWERVCQNEGDLLIRLDRIRFIDSTGIALLVRLRKALLSRQRRLILLAAAPAVRRALQAMGLWPFFVKASDWVQVQRILGSASPGPAVLRAEARRSIRRLAWQGEITAANALSVWEPTQNFLMTFAGRGEVEVRMEAVEFIDSTGLGLMVRAKKLAQARGLTLGFTGIQANVRNVIGLARLEEYLLI
jgi:N-acetylglucosaminyldiphosphoundecaprenol N-acetyl-beta-D-mannosaminyltransferase